MADHRDDPEDDRRPRRGGGDWRPPGRGGERRGDRSPSDRPREGRRPFERPRGGGDRPCRGGDRPGYGRQAGRPDRSGAQGRPWDRPPRPAGGRPPEGHRRPRDERPFDEERRFREDGPPDRRSRTPFGAGDRPRPPFGAGRRPGFGPPSGRDRDRDSGYRPPGRADGRRTAQREGPLEDLLAEGEELIAGRRPVEEAFAAGRPARRLLVVPERRQALEALVLHATTLRIPVVEVEGGTLTSLAGFDGHQGVALVLPARPPAGLDDVLARARARGQAPFVLVLDSLEDPQNLGTLLRSAEACAVDGVIFPTRRSAPLSPAAIKASAGATEHLLLVPVDDLAATMADLRGRGLRLIGADEGAPLRYGEADLRGPLALVVGSEGRGISGALRRRLDMVVRIPMRGRVASLNAAVAGSVLLFAAAEQRGVAEAGEVPPGGSPADTEPPPDELAAAGPGVSENRRAGGGRRRRTSPAHETSLAPDAVEDGASAPPPAAEAVAGEDLLPGEQPAGDEPG